MIRNLRSKVFILLVGTLVLIAIYLMLPKHQIIGSIQETKIDLADKSKQKSISEFKKERKEYSYVSFDNLSENTTLYYGTKIYQIGHIKNLDTEHKYLLVALDGNDASRTVKLEYDISKFARDDTDFQRDDPIEFYGRVLTTDNYVNEKGRDMTRPVISADFIQNREKQGDKNDVV